MAPIDLFDLVAKISLDTGEYEKGIKGVVNSAGTMAKNIGSGAAKAVGGIVKVGTAAITAGAGAVGALTKLSLDAYGDYEQLVGGVETLFGSSADVVMGYAKNAYKTAGLSANEYMETATSFSASLLQSLGGDTAKAAEYADVAISDMSDNANKMGSSMESIQNAYQGFAKQNYTMLDNLKLGYGGTKTEMERLIQDAEGLSDSFTAQRDESGNLTMAYSDVVDAIHIVQQNMGITGTTAKEAAETIQGSISMTKSAWENVLSGIGDDTQDFDALMDNLVTSVGMAAKNILPRVQSILTGVTKMISGLAPVVAKAIPYLVSNVLPSLAQAGVDIITALIAAITDNSATLINAGMDIVVTIAGGIVDNVQLLAEKAPEIISQLVIALTNNAPALVAAAVLIIEALVNGLADSMPALMEAAPEIITTIITVVGNHAPELIDAAITIVTELANGIIENGPALIDTAIQTLVDVVADVFGIPDDTVNSFKGTLETISADGAALFEQIKTAVTDVINKLPDLDINWSSVWDGMSAAVDAVTVVLSDVISGISEFIGWLTSGSAGAETFKTAVIAVGTAFAAWTIIQTITGFITTLSGVITTAKARFAALNAVMAANPIGIVVVAIAGLVAGITYLWNTNEDFRNAVTEIWDGIKSTISGVIDGIKGFFDGLGEKIDSVKEWFGDLKDGIGEKFGEIKDGASEKLDELGTAVSEKFTAIGDTMGNVMDAAKDTVSEKLDNIKTAYDEHGGGIQGAAAAAMEGVKGYYTAGYDFIDTLTGGKLSDIASSMGEKVQTAKNNVANGWTSIQTNASSTWNNIKSTATSVWDSIKSAISDKIDAAKEAVTSTIDNLKTKMSDTWNNIKTKASTTWNNIKTAVTTPFNNAKTTLANTVDNIKSKVTGVWDSIKNKTTDAWNNIKTAITSPIESAKSLFTSAIDTMRNALNFSWHLPHLSLPHISVTGGVAPFGIGGRGSLPHFSISWYKKAMDNAMLLDSPTIFGMAGDKFLGGGEAGLEVVSGANTLMNMIRDAVQGGGSQPVYNITINGAEYGSEEEIARAVSRELERARRMRGAALAY